MGHVEVMAFTSSLTYLSVSWDVDTQFALSSPLFSPLFIFYKVTEARGIISICCCLYPL
jgi:hypothetical protein